MIVVRSLWNTASVRARRSRSAQGVAAERALLADMGVVDDPYACSMLAPSMHVAYRLARRWPDRIPTLRVTLAGLAARVLWHDMQVSTAIARGVRQIAVIGAGYDSRAWRFASHGVRFFEVDHPGTQHDKIQRAPRSGPTYVAADLSVDSLAAALQRGGLDTGAPAVFVLEGLTMYLPEHVVSEQLAGLAEACAPASVLSSDFYPPPAVEESEHVRQNRLQRIARAGSGEGLRLLVDRDAACALLATAGWQVDEARGARDVAVDLVGSATDLPVNSVNNDKSFISARLAQPTPDSCT